MSQDTQSELEADIDEFVKNAMRTYSGIPDFLDDLDTISRLAEWLSQKGWRRMLPVINDTPEMVERLAAVAQDTHEQLDVTFPYDESQCHDVYALYEAAAEKLFSSTDVDECWRYIWRVVIRAVLTAMREPTDAMLEAFKDCLGSDVHEVDWPVEFYGDKEELKAIFAKMIDAALGKKG